MTADDGRGWLGNFRILSDRLFPHIVGLIPSCVHSLGADVSEDAITRNLVSRLAISPELRGVVVLEYNFEPFRPDGRGNQQSTGRIDFIARPADVWNRDLYVAYECKRLNVRESGRIRSRASEYVLNGVCRFATGQYSAGLPLGCMLGYVEDGDVGFANQRVRKMISAHSSATSVIGLPITLSEDTRHVQFETVHSRSGSGGSLRVRHILVSCVC